MIKTIPKASPSKGQGIELLVHIVKRKANGDMEDITLCGKLWDKTTPQARNICEECKEVAKRCAYDALRPV